MKHGKILKFIALLLILILTMIMLTGCEYFDVRKQQQEIKEDTIEYLNDKYSGEQSFKKYQRKDIKKVVGDNSHLACYLCHTFIGKIEPFVEFDFSASGTIVMKDGTIVRDASTDNRQYEEIKKDFEKYYFKEFFGKYDYTDNSISFLSTCNQGLEKYDNGQFAKYYDGDIEEYIKGERIYVDSDIVIWIEPLRWAQECENIKNSFENADFELLLDGNVYFMNKNMKNKVDISDYSSLKVGGSEGLLGYLDARRSSNTVYYNQY